MNPQERWGFHAHHGARLLRSLDVAHLIEGNGESLPLDLPETALRPLAPLEPPLQLAIWHLAGQIGGPTPSSRVINDIVRAVRHAIDRGTEGENGTRDDSRKSPRSSTSGQKDFFITLHQLTSGHSGFSAYLAIRQIDETTAKSHLAACQHAITMCHEVIEGIRERYPWT